MEQKDAASIKRNAYIFILIISISSLFCDMTHAGAKSLYGAFLNYLSVSAATIGFVSGLAQFTANALTVVTGYIADRWKNYWTLTITGYLFSLVSIPALALVSDKGWMIACFLIVFERLGKACWSPARNTLISFTASEVGSGKSFSIQSAFNKFGACLGPLILFLVLLLKSDISLLDRYHLCFAILGIPALVGIGFLLLAKKRYSHPEKFEQLDNRKETKEKSSKIFILFSIGIAFFGLGFLDFPLITMHLARISSIQTATLPLFFSGAMFISALASLFFGRLFDKFGILILAITTLLSSTFAFLIFGDNNMVSMIVGILIWGLGIGSVETILKSVTAILISKENRSKGFGVLNLFFGLALFAGSWLCGILYDYAKDLLMIFSCVMQLIAVVFFVVCDRMLKKESE